MTTLASAPRAQAQTRTTLESITEAPPSRANTRIVRGGSGTAIDIRGSRAELTRGLGIYAIFGYPLELSKVDGNVEFSTQPSTRRRFSGCGVWRLHTKGEDADRWDVKRIRLVGIEHSVLPNRWIRGTRVRHVIAGVASRYPELNRVVALIGINW